MVMFKDRVAAGESLATQLNKSTFQRPLVLGIPRGGVVVAFEIARKLEIPLDVIVSRKIGAPGNPELAVGAVTQDGTAIFNEKLLQRIGLRPEGLDSQVQQVRQEIDRRMTSYRGAVALPELEGRDVILVDDGIATGYTVLAALRSMQKQSPRRIVLAVPVAPPDALERMRPEVDEILCLAAPAHFYAVGQFYQNFAQTTDQEVIELLQKRSCAQMPGEGDEEI